jgi:hypothetical protein
VAVVDLHTNGIVNCVPTGAQDDIVGRLRRAAVGLDMNQTAADEIERLRATLKLVTEHPSHTDGYANSAQHCESCAEIMETINDL